MSKQLYSRLDHYSRQAIRQGYPARSVYKLQQIDNKYNIIKSHKCNIIDFGCSPGSWIKYCTNKVKQGNIIGMDLTYVDIHKLCSNEQSNNKNLNIQFIQQDITKWQIPTEYTNGYFDVILSDMMSLTTGYKDIDHDNSIMLCMYAIKHSNVILNNNGSLLMKIMQGSETDKLINYLRTLYHSVKTIKPEASRKNSVEMFVLCQKKKIQNNNNSNNNN